MCIRDRYGDECYTDILKYKEEIEEYLEQIELKTKQKKALLSQNTWTKHKKLLEIAYLLKEKIGTDEYDDFNIFKKEVEKFLKEEKIKLSATEKNTILNAMSWYDESAKKVIKKVSKISGEKLEKLLDYLGCDEEQFANYGYYKTDKADEYIEYEAETDLRDSENIPLEDDIQSYFLKEVKPYAEEAWINMTSVKIGYEISFNKYFYKHKPFRSIEEVTADILELEKQSDGLIREILGLDDE